MPERNLPASHTPNSSRVTLLPEYEGAETDRRSCMHKRLLNRTRTLRVFFDIFNVDAPRATTRCPNWPSRLKLLLHHYRQRLVTKPELLWTQDVAKSDKVLQWPLE